MFNRNILIITKGLDDQFFFSFEDQDFCKRILNNNLKVVYYPESKIIHIGGQSSNKLKKFNTILLNSRLYFQEKHYGNISKIFYKIILLISSVINLTIIPIIFICLKKSKHKDYLMSSLKFNFRQIIFLIKLI